MADVVIAHLKAAAIGLDVFVNALLGGRPYQTMSCRIGESILSKGWASRVPWPLWWRRHCLNAIYQTIV